MPYSKRHTGASATRRPEDVIQVRVERDVTDSDEGLQVVYEGNLDLTAGSGSIEIDPTDVEPWCSGEVPN